jgi:RecA-family ATPase
LNFYRRRRAILFANRLAEICRENKLIRMGQMYRRMGLNKAQIQQVRENTAVLVIDDLQDTKAVAEIERHAQARKPDIIWLNPLTSYLSG